MTKKLLSALVALAVVLTAMSCLFVMADTTDAETPTDVVVYKLIFDANTGKGSMDEIVLDAAGTAKIPAVKFEKEFYDFTGWNTNADGSGDAYAEGDEIAIDGEVTLYAQWIHKGADFKEFTVTYDANGGEGETIDDFNPYTEGSVATTVFNEFTRNGYYFVEWNTKADGTGDSYGEWVDLDFEMTADVVLYAIWESDGTLPPEESSTVEPESSVDEPSSEAEPEPSVDDATDTDVVDDIPKTGDASAVAVAAGLCTAVAAAFVVLKKKN